MNKRKWGTLYMDYKQIFVSIFEETIKRSGASELLEWLEKTDFFTAPASTRYHLNCDEGLLQHSLNVYRYMKDHLFDEKVDSLESFAICGLLHDLCKANFYKRTTRNVKNANGQWEQQPYFTIEDQFPFGHGEKSVFLIERFMRLKPAEAIAIRWHMGGFDETARAGGGSISQAYAMYPLAVKLHIADVAATYLVESTKNVQ